MSGPYVGLWTDQYDQAALDDTGADWTTALVSWAATETQNNVYNWGPVDETLVAASNGGRRQVLVAISFTPSWVGPVSCRLTTPQERAFFAEFMAALVSRYSGRSGLIPDGPLAGQATNIKYWSLYNEVNNTDPVIGQLFGGCFGTLNANGQPTTEGPTNYARVIADVGPVIHAADPASRVVFSGLPSAQFIGVYPACGPTTGCPFDGTFFTETLRILKNLGALGQLDVVMVNYFSSQTFDWGFQPFGVDLIGRINKFRQDMRDAGLTESELKPIIVQENSYTDRLPNGQPGQSTSNPNDTYNIGQRDYVVRSLARAASLDLLAIFWFKLQDTSGGAGGDAAYGLRALDGLPKPSYVSFRYFNRLVDRQDRFVRALTLNSARLEGYEFKTTDGRDLQIVWRNKDPRNPNDPDVLETYSPAGRVIKSVTGPLEDARAFSNNTVNVGFTPLFLFFDQTCTPRPQHTITAVPDAGRLRVTVRAGVNAGTPTNSLQRLTFNAVDNGLIDVPPGTTGGGSGLVLNLPPGTTEATFFLRRVAAGQGATVRYTITDACGNWPTFAGGGPTAF